MLSQCGFKFFLKLGKYFTRVKNLNIEGNAAWWFYDQGLTHEKAVDTDMIDSAWWTMDRGSWHCTGDRDQDHPQEKEMLKSKMAVREALTNSCEQKRSKKQRRKGKTYPFECRVPKNSKEKKESLLQQSMQRNRGKQ